MKDQRTGDLQEGEGTSTSTVKEQGQGGGTARTSKDGGKKRRKRSWFGQVAGG